jgi:hypothetical protein
MNIEIEREEDGRWIAEVPNLPEKNRDRHYFIATIRGVRGHDRAGHGLLEPLHSATRIM